MIDNWQRQYAIRAIVDAADALCLQISRYTDADQKDSRSISIPPGSRVEVPFFSAERVCTDVRRCAYRVVLVVFHVGPTVV